MQKVHLVIIDGQNDFCDPDGALFVPGAKEDMERLTSFINRTEKKLFNISLTLDSHHLIDIAHPSFWRSESNGQSPNPFTIITPADVESGKWTTAQPSFYKRSLEYVRQLEKNGRYPLCVWPPHCLIASWGHNVYPSVHDAVTRWESENFAIAQYITKGSNYLTEHYSALRADVPDASDPATQINTEFIRTLVESDFVVIAGEASSHCVLNTVKDMIEAEPSMASKIVLLKDAMSPVSSFEKLADDFFSEMLSKGVKISTTTEFLN